ncbi:HAD family hydrolase [Nitratireductor sp. GISD-1A_MAKvit]|uniref:haloacid dehalogenase-like hydrolase n=1 Tax=Nitratireductor sp. GISD-1A_MAKvit TaxID=3234198 RepID=UPI003466D98F
MDIDSPSPQRTALIYDFDGTLAHGNLQERSFIPDIGMERTEFWDEVKQQTREHDADEVLVYMHMMLRKAASLKKPITKEALRKHGEDAPLFPGLADGSWFDRINTFGQERNLCIEHYIVSSGISEMIDGCKIREKFKKIYASKFIYINEEASWPGVGINYTTKTQYLFRINKGIENNWDNISINSFKPENERPIPFDRMIFFGDGDTDIPTMKMLTYKGGNSIAVYDPSRGDNDLSKIHRLISDGRVEFVAPADYSENSQLDIITRGILGRIARSCGYRPNEKQHL